VAVEGLPTIRDAAGDADRDPGSIEITVWPGSWDYIRGTDPALLREFAVLGVDRIVLTAAEAGATDVETVASSMARLRSVRDDVSG